MKCANCGNEDSKSLFLDDKGKVFCCRICYHRTQTATGQDDLIMCPYCGRLRDRLSNSCMWCGNPIQGRLPPSKEEYEETDKIVSEFEAKLDPSNVRFWKLSLINKYIRELQSE